MEKPILSFAVSIAMLCVSHMAFAQNIGIDNFQVSIDNASSYNGGGNATGSKVTLGATVTGYASVNGVTGNQGTTYVNCYSSPSGLSFSKSTTTSTSWEFSWTPSAVGTYTVYCSADYTGTYANGTVYAGDITVPVIAPPPPAVQGLLYPKYMVVGVTYAPPGPSSYVQYTGTTSVGSTTTISSSFSNDAGFSVSVKTGAGFSGFGPKGSLTVTESTDYTQGSNSSTTDTISKLTSLAYKTAGTGNAFSPVDSDYDTIWLWLNPVVILDVTPATSSTPVGIQWNGYGFDTDDPSGTEQPDVYPVLVGWLNGHFGVNPSINTILARGWQSTADGYTWPTGQGPGLTGVGDPTAGTDVANIIAADPLTNSSYTLLDSFPSTTSDGRFTIMEGSNTPNPIPYEQAGPGNGGGITTVYNTTQTDTQSVAKGTSNTTKQAFSVQTVFGDSAWVADITLTLTASDTLTWTNTWLNTLTTTTTLADALSVTGPGCPAAPPGPCSPEYAGPGQFLVYQDNQFGTFMFYPSN